MQLLKFNVGGRTQKGTEMANKFTQTAKEALGGSPIMNGRTKISTEDLINTYPQGISITGFDIIHKADGSQYPVFTFAEDATKFFNGGSLAQKIVDAWLRAGYGDIEGVNAELKQDPAKFIVGKGKTKGNRDITTYTPVE